MNCTLLNWTLNSSRLVVNWTLLNWTLNSSRCCKLITELLTLLVAVNWTPLNWTLNSWLDGFPSDFQRASEFLRVCGLANVMFPSLDCLRRTLCPISVYFFPMKNGCKHDYLCRKFANMFATIRTMLNCRKSKVGSTCWGRCGCPPPYRDRVAQPYPRFGLFIWKIMSICILCLCIHHRIPPP